MDTLEEYCGARLSTFLERTGLSPTRLGRMAAGDPSLVRRIERDCSLILRTADRILAFIGDYTGDSGGARDPPHRPRQRKPSRAEENEEDRVHERAAEK